MSKSLNLLLLILLTSVSTNWSQEITGNLEGRVLNSQGEPLPAVNIIVESPSLQGERGATTNNQGYFRVLALAVGTYDVKIQHVAHQEMIFQNVTIRLGKTTTLGEICLRSRVLEITEIVVFAKKPLIDPTSTVIGAGLVSKEFEVLPVERNYRNITTLLPQANESFLGDEINFAGATGLENKYFIDGIDATDPYRGCTGTNLPYNFVNEIEIRTGGYQAEYRSSLGAIVNVITYAGGNDFHGEAFGFFANNRFSSDPRQGAVEPKKGDFSQYDFGFSLRGPIIRDKLWFNAAYNPTYEREDVDIPGVGFFNDNHTTHIFAGKITWQASSNTNLTLTLFGDPRQREAVGETFFWWGTPSSFENPDPYLADVETGGINLVLKGIHVISNAILLESSLSRMIRKDKYMPTTERGRNEPLYIDNETTMWSGGYPMFVDNLSALTAFDIKGTLIFGSHTFKTGFEYKDNRLDDNRRADVIYRYNPMFYQVGNISIKGTVRNRIPSLFAQDSWRFSDRLRINVGLRWDGQFLVGSNGKVAQKITDQYQPRIGFIYQPGKIGSQKIFGSFGRFYQELSTYLSSAIHIDGAKFMWANYDHDPRIDPSGGDSITVYGTIHPEVEGLEGQHYDEFTLGYEQIIGSNFKIGVRCIYRTLRQAIEDGFVPEVGDFVMGNPGNGKLSHFPKTKREYTALEFTIHKSGGKKISYFASYVLSRTYGNYPGLFNSDYDIDFPNANGSFDFAEMLNNGTGLLPNDRTHVFKFSGSYKLDFGLTVGTSLLWQSGTPLNEFGGSQAGPPWNNFIRKRGTAGRTPSIWDLNVRFVYDLSRITRTSWKARLILDIFHVGSLRDPVDFEQVHYFNLDEKGNQIDPNPNYRLATRYKPPMAVRLGIEIGF